MEDLHEEIGGDFAGVIVADVDGEAGVPLGDGFLVFDCRAGGVGEGLVLGGGEWVECGGHPWFAVDHLEGGGEEHGFAVRFDGPDVVWGVRVADEVEACRGVGGKTDVLEAVFLEAIFKPGGEEALDDVEFLVQEDFEGEGFVAFEHVDGPVC